MSQLTPGHQVDDQGLRPFASIDTDDVFDCGVEAADLATLAQAGLPLANGYLVRLRGEMPFERLLQAAQRCLKRGCREVLLRPMFGGGIVVAKLNPRLWNGALVRDESELARRIAELQEMLADSETLAVFGGSVTGLCWRVIGSDSQLQGRAASMHPQTGDPDELVVWSHGGSASTWTVERRSMQVIKQGEGGGLLPAQVTIGADLADRAQLALGLPVELEWCVDAERLAILGVHRLTPQPCFGKHGWRRVALVAADEGTVAPLAIDALANALQRPEDRSPATRVRRMYARPYRRLDVGATRLHAGGDPGPMWRGAWQAACVAADVAVPTRAVRRLEHRLRPQLERFATLPLQPLGAEELADVLRDRYRWVVECFKLLERSRLATLAVLAGLETTLGTLPRSAVHALAAPTAGRERLRVQHKLQRLFNEIEDEHGGLPPLSSLTRPQQQRWQQLRSELASWRPLGIDVRPPAFGSDDATLTQALQQAALVDDERPRRARRDATRRLVALARAKRLGRSRETLIVSTIFLASRVARTKGRIAEVLAATLGGLRLAAVEVGRRLVGSGLLAGVDDVFYLGLAEILEALAGDPGAYTARATQRREDDARWARYEAPRRLERYLAAPILGSVR